MVKDAGEKAVKKIKATEVFGKEIQRSERAHLRTTKHPGLQKEAAYVKLIRVRRRRMIKAWSLNEETEKALALLAFFHEPLDVSNKELCDIGTKFDAEFEELEELMGRWRRLKEWRMRCRLMKPNWT